MKNPPDPRHSSRDALQYGGKGERSPTTPQTPMAHFVTLNYQTKQGVKDVKIKPNWAGKGLAVHKPVVFNEDTHEAEFSKERGIWILSHVGSGLRAGISFGNLERAKKYAKEWDQEFAKLNPEKISAKFKKEWKLVADEMKQEPPRKPIGSRRLRALSCASTAATAA